MSPATQSNGRIRVKFMELSALFSGFVLSEGIAGASFADKTPLTEPIANVEFVFMLWYWLIVFRLNGLTRRACIDRRKWN